jgi:prepilin-type N-terminal cleavage/methylation domain-containing protein
MRNHGFSMIELIIATAVMAIIMAIASVSLLKLRKDSAVRDASTMIASALRQARGESQRYNSDVTFTVDADGKSFKLTRSDNERRTYLPDNTYVEVAISGATTTTFQAPYGQAAPQTGSAYCVSLGALCSSSAHPLKINVGVVGLSGKVVVYAQ